MSSNKVKVPTPRGRATDWADEDMEEMSLYSPEDLDDAEGFWEEQAPERFKFLLLAGARLLASGIISPQESIESSSPAFEWAPSERRYIDTMQQRVVSPREVRASVDVVIDGAKAEMVSVTKAMQSGQMTVSAWQQSMAEQVRVLHLANTAAARGGVGQVSVSDMNGVVETAREQFRYLRKFALQVETGKQKLDGSLIQRVEMYGEAGRNTYEEAMRERERESGMTHEWNVLGDADHCDDCLDATGQGKVPLGTLTLPGDRRCLTNCHCTLEYGIEEEEALVA